MCVCLYLALNDSNCICLLNYAGVRLNQDTISKINGLQWQIYHIIILFVS